MLMRSRYSDAVIGGRSEDQPACLHPDETRGAPGSRVPYAWLNETESTIDYPKHGLRLLMGPEPLGWAQPVADAVREIGLALSGVSLPHETLHRFGIGPTGALLVRPDGFVAWRAESDAEASAEEMLRVLGAVHAM